jgi:hypothetical protein
MGVKHTTPADGTFSASGAAEWNRPEGQAGLDEAAAAAAAAKIER